MFLKSQSEILKLTSCYTIEMLTNLKVGDFNLYQLENYFNKNNTIDFIANVLENLYFCAKNNPIETYILKAILSIVNIMDESCCNFVEPFSDLFRDLIKKLSGGYTFQNAFLVYEALGYFIKFSIKVSYIY